MHKEREDGKGGLPEFLPWQPDKFVWLHSTAAARSCTFCLLLKVETFLEPEWRQGGCAGPAHSWPHSLARQRAFLVANGHRLLLAAWLFLPDPSSCSCRQPSNNPVINPRCCKFDVAGPAQQKSNPLICWGIKHAAKFKYSVEDWAQHQELDWMILMHPFQPRIFYDPANLIH